MGRCTLCGEPAGWFRSIHPECKRREHEREVSLTHGVLAIAHAEERITAEEANERLAVHMPEPGGGPAGVGAWSRAVDEALDDDVLTETEQHNLEVLHAVLGLSGAGDTMRESAAKLVKAVVIREVMRGEPVPAQPDWMRSTRALPFNFQKSEHLIWAFDDVDYYEDKRRTRYEGGSRGISVRVARGVYLRTGATKGERIETMETVHADTGMLAVTTKHLYFAGPKKGFRVRHDKIISFEQYSDGIGIMRDAGTATPQRFRTGDGWFTYNLLANADTSR